jgi:hypothetical protein
MNDKPVDQGLPWKTMFDPISPWLSYDVPSRICLLRPFCEAGVTPAIHDTLTLVLDNKLQVPEWLAEQLLELVRNQLQRPDEQRAMYKSRMRHFYRWRQVRRLRNEGVKGDDVYYRAAQAFEGTPLECGEEMIKKSHDKVQNALKDKKETFKYYTAMKATRILTDTYDFQPQPNMPSHDAGRE